MYTYGIHVFIFAFILAYICIQPYILTTGKLWFDWLLLFKPFWFLLSSILLVCFLCSFVGITLPFRNHSSICVSFCDFSEFGRWFAAHRSCHNPEFPKCFCQSTHTTATHKHTRNQLDCWHTRGRTCVHFTSVNTTVCCCANRKCRHVNVFVGKKGLLAHLCLTFTCHH